jgi:hypothetical protein
MLLGHPEMWVPRCQLVLWATWRVFMTAPQPLTPPTPRRAVTPGCVTCVLTAHNYVCNCTQTLLQVLARSSPEDKRTLVKALREMGEIVAVTVSRSQHLHLPSSLRPVIILRALSTCCDLSPACDRSISYAVGCTPNSIVHGLDQKHVIAMGHVLLQSASPLFVCC